MGVPKFKICAKNGPPNPADPKFDFFSRTQLVFIILCIFFHFVVGWCHGFRGLRAGAGARDWMARGRCRKEATEESFGQRSPFRALAQPPSLGDYITNNIFQNYLGMSYICCHELVGPKTRIMASGSQEWK